MKVKDKILTILHSVKPEANFEQSNDYIGDGLLDSFDIILLIAEIDKTFAISVDGSDVLPDNFMTVDTIAILLEEKYLPQHENQEQF